MSRHAQLHDLRRPPPKPRKKACIACFRYWQFIIPPTHVDEIRAKVKCNGERPTCSACRKRRTKCFYASPNAHTSSSDVDLAIGEDQIRTRTIVEELAALSEKVTGDEQYPGAQLLRISVSPTSDYSSAVNDVATREDVVYVSTELDLLKPIYGQRSAESNFEWMFNDLPEIVFPSPTQSLRHRFPLLYEPISESTQRAFPHPEEQRTDSPLDLPHTNSQDTLASEDSWLVDWTSVPKQGLLLPRLGGDDAELLPTSYVSTGSITPAIRIKLLDHVRMPLERGPWAPVSLANFPSCQTLEHCIDMYFAHFHNVSLPSF